MTYTAGLPWRSAHSNEPGDQLIRTGRSATDWVPVGSSSRTTRTRSELSARAATMCAGTSGPFGSPCNNVSIKIPTTTPFETWGIDGLSVHVLSAVDLDGRAVDVARPVGEEERDRGRDLLGLADAAERDGRGHGRLAFVGELAAHNLGVDRPGSQDVDGDAEGTQFSRTTTAHADDRCLGCRIDALGERPAAIECRDRGGVDDAADAPGNHPLGGCLEHEVGARDVDRHDPLELLELDFVQRYRAGNPGEVDQGHDRRQLLVDSCEGGGHGVLGRDVCGDGKDVLVPRVHEVLLDLGETLRVVVDQGDVPAALCEGAGDGSADTGSAARAGDDCRLLCGDGIGVHECSLLDVGDAAGLWPLVRTSVTTCANARVSWANRPRKSPSTAGPRLWYVPGPAPPPYSRRDRPAYESSRTRRCSQTSVTYSAGAGALAPIAT